MSGLEGGGGGEGMRRVVEQGCREKDWSKIGREPPRGVAPD